MNRRLWSEHPVIVTVAALAVAATLVGFGVLLAPAVSGPSNQAVLADSEDSAGQVDAENDATQPEGTETGEGSEDTPDGPTIEASEMGIGAEPDRVGLNLQINNNFGFDADSQQDDWGIAKRNDEHDMYFSNAYRDASAENRYSPITSESGPNRQECDSPTLARFDGGRILLDAFSDGDSLCLETNNGGMAWIEIVQYRDNQMIFNVYYWDE